ncbi:MAG: AAA family ATPase [Bacteroidales bacterium]|nr:AAA family ATPase [Bacteroidales bacterium]
MDKEFFDLTNPFEKTVCDRLEEYLLRGASHDVALDLIGRDFPYLDSDLREKCEIAAYIHCFSGSDDKIAATIKRVAFMHKDYMDDPFYSHNGNTFQVKNGEDIVAAVMVENPLYLYDKANVHLTLHINGTKINEFRHTMGMEYRRNVYYIPLNLLDTDLFESSTTAIVNVEVVNEHIEGQRTWNTLYVYKEKKNASEIFEVDKMDICAVDGGVGKSSFQLGTFEFLYLNMSLVCKDSYSQVPMLQGTYTLIPNDSNDKREKISGTITFFTPELFYDKSEGTTVILNSIDSFHHGGSTPLYRPRPGKYTLSFYIWDTLIKSKEIVFEENSEESFENDSDVVSQSDDFDMILDNFIKDMELEKINEGSAETSDEPKKVQMPDVNPFEYLEVVGLNLYNINCDTDDKSRCLDGLNSLPQTSFAADQLKMLSVVGKFKKLQNPDIITKNFILRWNLYDQTGRLVDWQCVEYQNVESEIWIYAAFGSFCNQKWSKGTYRLELKYTSHSLINAVFTIGDINVSSDYDPHLISRKIETIEKSVDGSALAKLNKMAGLEKVKEKIHSLMNTHNLQIKRSKAGLPVKQPSLHARFLGNPGTGKTTVARLLGQIYKEMGLLSSGHVVLEERKNMIGRYYDSEGQAVENALNRAKGGILLIDEAYNLYVEDDEKDPGRRILEYLLTALSDENNRDWMLIVAGYPAETERMLKSNPGLDSRINEVFEFEDFDVDTLMEIAELYCSDNRYELSNEAKDRLRSVIARDYAEKDENFGNGRYVNNLMDTAINTKMATRLSTVASPTIDQLVTIEAEDIPVEKDEADIIAATKFDEAAIDDALKRLDSLVGLEKVKSAIHNFVKVSRYLKSRGERFTGKGMLKWNFTGNTGTGKSTVADILADILKAMNLIHNSEVTEIKGEEIFNVTDYECNEVLKDAVKRARKGLLLIDGDAPEFRSSEYRMTSEQVRFKLANLVSDNKGTGAIVIAECSSPQLSIAHSLASNGIYDYDHTFIFDDYTDEQLYQILIQCLDKHNVKMSAEAEEIIQEYIKSLCANRELSFANARTMKNLSRAIFDTLLLRLSTTGGEDRTVLACDVESFVWKKISSKIGF